jgi:hypothetical protein
MDTREAFLKQKHSEADFAGHPLGVIPDFALVLQCCFVLLWIASASPALERKWPGESSTKSERALQFFQR